MSRLHEEDRWEYASFSQDHWTPALVEKCLRQRRILEELVLWGTQGSEWPPSMTSGYGVRNYPTDINAMLTRADFQRAWKALPRKDRRLLRMYYEEGMTQEEIGGRIDYSQRHIGRLIEGVRHKLESFLGCDV